MEHLFRKRQVQQICSIAQQLHMLSDAALREKMQSLRGDGFTDSQNLAFALTYEAFRRTIGITPYPEQISGALAMCGGCVSQIQTGEGKTATAVFPACYYALSGKSVCIATVNPYLAKRDSEWMRPVYEMLGFTVGLTEAGMDNVSKQEAYRCSIIYGTHSEFGFDYLRDQLVTQPEHLVQPEPFFMLVDEADSILLDEAVTPMILSGKGLPPDKRIYAVDHLVHWLKPVYVQTLEEEDYEKLDAEYDYIVMLKEKVAILTSLGAKHASQYFPKDDFDNNVDLNHLLYQALQAHGTLHRDVDYIVVDGGLRIVDQNTGRIAEGRRFCDGLWQALEVKEGLDVLEESATFASISYQQFFKRYPILCGMTGTAKDERRELEKVYGLPVKCIPPHKPNQRRDLSDVYCPTPEKQLDAIAQEVGESYARRQPCLIVTRSVVDSERMAEALSARQIPCEVLNARSHEQEAEIIAKAGIHGHVTVATAMAGRGTDIKPDDEALVAGGLFVIGLGHQNTRRGDRQLMGRSGRQGNPGKTRFFVSPKDDLLSRFCPDQKLDTQRRCLSAVRQAQRNCEATAQSQRKTAVEMDEIIGNCRRSFYEKRSQVLHGYCPEEYSHKPPDAVKSVILSEMDKAWMIFLAVSDQARQNTAAVSMTGRNVRNAYVTETAGLFDEIFSDMRQNIAKAMQCLPNLIQVTVKTKTETEEQ